MKKDPEEYQKKQAKTPDTEQKNSREDMTVKNIATDNKSNTATEEGLNQASNPANALEPGTRKGDE